MDDNDAILPSALEHRLPCIQVRWIGEGGVDGGWRGGEELQQRPQNHKTTGTNIAGINNDGRIATMMGENGWRGKE